MDEIAELRDALGRLHAAMDDLVVRGVRAAGATEIARLTALRDEFRTAGAEHLAEKLSTLVDAVNAGERSAAPALMRAVTTFRLFDRMLTLEAARAALTAPEAGADEVEEVEEEEEETEGEDE
jgi:precorrin isomerase